MNRSDKFSIVFGFLLEALAVFFICTVLMQFFAYGEQQPAIFKIGAVLFQAYGYSSILVPLCMFAAGLLVFAGLCTMRWSIYLACSVFPFITVVFAEKIAKNFLMTDTSALLGFKIAAVFVVAALAVAIEYVLIGMFSDYVLVRKAMSHAKKNEKDDIPLNAFSKETTKVVAEPAAEEAEKNAQSETEEPETLAFETTSILTPSDTETFAEKLEKAEKAEEQPETSENAEETAEPEKNEADKDNVTFIIPQYVPYGEQIAKKGSVWKNYSKIGDYIRKTPNKGTPAEEIESENKEEKIEKEAIQELDKENEEKQILPIQAEEEPVFVNFKRILVPDAPIIPDDNAEAAKPEEFANEESPIEALHKSLKEKTLQQDAEIAAEPEYEAFSEETENVIEDSVSKVNSTIAANSYIEQTPEVTAEEIAENFTSQEEAAFLENPFDEIDYSNEPAEIAPEPAAEPVAHSFNDAPLTVEKIIEQAAYKEPETFKEPEIEEIKPAAEVEAAEQSDTIEELETVVEDADFEDITEEPEEILDVEEATEDVADEIEDADIPSFSEELESFEEPVEYEDKADDFEENAEAVGESETGEPADYFQNNFTSLTTEEKEPETFEEPEISPEERFEHELAQKAMPLSAPKPVKEYKIPTEGLLDTYPDGQYWIIDEETERAGEILKETLSEFKIEADVTAIRKGPVITMFEILPAPGVKLNKIVGLQDNIALRLAASSVRIVAPIPGKHAVGIEVPNKQRSIVSFRELIDNDSPLFDKMEVPVVLGKDITGEAKLLDLAATPHLLIAGSTGSGKSVCVNTMILSILYKRTPQQVKMILIDPKVVELKLYNDIPHLLTPVITEPKKAFQSLQYCLCEMERRYALLDRMGVRDIKSYNRRIKERNLANEKLPYIVVVIDEFADLMATTGKELESTIARLAAMSRAVGIHLVLATQRPSIDVITGLIKANIPTRIAFMVASKMDSRIIIDQVGAEKLLGKGDMLYASAVDPFPVRIQGTFVSDNEVENVVEYVKKYGPPEYIDEEIFFDEEEEETDPSLFSDGEDPLYEKALEIVLQAGKASASYIQRRLKIGYNRAARLVEEMEARGIVGPANGSKPRDVIHVPSRATESSMAHNE